MISFSGIDCSGKTTQIKLLCDELKNKEIKHQVIWSRGGYTPGIEFLKRLLREKREMSIKEKVAYSEATNRNTKRRKLLFIASLVDLCIYYSITLRLKELFGTFLICDRYIWDTYIDFKMKYSEYDFEQGFWWTLTLKTMIQPKISYVLFIPVEESLRRSELKDEPFPESSDLRRQRIQMYIDEQKNNRWHYLIDATKSIEEVHNQIKGKLIIEQA